MVFVSHVVEIVGCFRYIDMDMDRRHDFTIKRMYLIRVIAYRKLEGMTRTLR